MILVYPEPYWTRPIGDDAPDGINAYVNAFVFTASFAPDGFAPMQRFGFGEAAPLWLRAMAFSPFATGINLVMLGGCIRNAWEGPAHWAWRLASGLLHGTVHGLAIFALYWAACHALAGLEPSPWLGPANWVAVAGVVVGGLGLDRVPREWQRGAAAQAPDWRVIDRFTMGQ